MGARRFMVWLGAAAIVPSGAPACSHDAGDANASANGARIGRGASAVQGGQIDDAHAFAVGVCGLAAGPGQCGLVCSGTLVAPNLVLTARHCVDVPSSNADCATATWTGPRYTTPDQYWVTTSKDLYQGATGWHQVTAIRTPTDTALCGGDLALLLLKDVVPAAEATPAQAAIQYALTDHAHYGLSETAIGYGITSPGTNTEGTRHARSGIAIQCIPGDAQIGCDPKLTFAGSDKEFLAGDGTCDGDSGSGAFDDESFASGPFVVLGALSRGGVSNDGLTCIGAVYTRLDVWHDFLVGVAAEAAQKGGYHAPAWTAPAAPTDGGTDSSEEGGASNPSGNASHGCGVTQYYSSVPWQFLVLGLPLWLVRRRNCTRKRT